MNYSFLFSLLSIIFKNFDVSFLFIFLNHFYFMIIITTIIIYWAFINFDTEFRFYVFHLSRNCLLHLFSEKSLPITVNLFYKDSKINCSFTHAHNFYRYILVFNFNVTLFFSLLNIYPDTYTHTHTKKKIKENRYGGFTQCLLLSQSIWKQCK